MAKSKRIKEEFAELQAAADKLANRILEEEKERIVEGLYELADAHSTFKVLGAQVRLNSPYTKPSCPGLWVRYMQYRNDPLFDDYETTGFLPMDYILAPDYKAYIEQDKRQEREAREAEEDKKKKLKLKECKRALEFMKVEVEKLEKEASGG